MSSFDADKIFEAIKSAELKTIEEAKLSKLEARQYKRTLEQLNSTAAKANGKKWAQQIRENQELTDEMRRILAAREVELRSHGNCDERVVVITPTDDIDFRAKRRPGSGFGPSPKPDQSDGKRCNSVPISSKVHNHFDSKTI